MGWAVSWGFYPIAENWSFSHLKEYWIRHQFESLLVNIPHDTCSMVGGAHVTWIWEVFVAVFHLYSRKGLVCNL